MSDIHYIKLITNNNPMKDGSLKPKAQYRFFDELFHHCYMERLALCALIKHIFKTDLQKNKISFSKDFISRHMETLTFKYRPEN